MAIIKCPECGHQISDKARVCPNCGIEIEGKIIQCPQCGEIYFKNQSTCPKCHHSTNIKEYTTQQTDTLPTSPTSSISLQDDHTIENMPTSQKDSHKFKGYNVLIVATIIALLVCAVCLYFYTNAKGNKEQEAYEYAMNSQDPLVLQSFLDTYTDASEVHRDSIKAHLAALSLIDREWTNVVISNSKSDIEDYLNKHPDSPHKVEALHKIDSIDWTNAVSSNSKDALRSYLEDHPDGEHADEARNSIRGINAKTVQPEERQMISNVFRQFFQSINSRDEDGLTNTVNSPLTSFLGKVGATRSDVRTFLRKIYKDDVASMAWKPAGDYKIDKKEIGDGEYEYTIICSAVQEVEKTDDTIVTNKFRIKAKVNPDGKLTEFNMIKLLE